LLGNGLLSFSRHPDQWARLVADPKGLSASTVDEVLRYESSLVATYRTALEQTEIKGVTIAAGEKVLTLIGAANRDPRVFDDPNAFDIGRDARKHMSFGGGIHFCVGAELARLEGRIAFQHLAERLPNLKVETAAPAWREGFLFRGVGELNGQW
jgi:cytochrome P450